MRASRELVLGKCMTRYDLYIIRLGFGQGCQRRRDLVSTPNISKVMTEKQIFPIVKDGFQYKKFEFIIFLKFLLLFLLKFHGYGGF